MARLFFAVWPDDAARERLAALASEVARECGGRAVPAHNLHLTLAFLGEVADERRAALDEAARGVLPASFRLSLDRVGAFRRAKVAWAGTSWAPVALERWATSLRERLGVRGFAIEDRQFTPHLTLARKIERPPAARELAPVEWEVCRFTLVQSRPDGGRYEALERYGE